MSYHHEGRGEELLHNVVRMDPKRVPSMAAASVFECLGNSAPPILNSKPKLTALGYLLDNILVVLLVFLRFTSVTILILL